MKKLLALALWLAAAPAFANSFSPLATSPTPTIPANSINVTQPPYNVTSGAADNATALQSAINAAIAANVPLYIPAPASGCYKYTAPLTVSGNLSIVGDWVAGNWNGQINVPNGSPAIVGSVLCPSANGSDGVDISGTTPQVNVSNIGMLFQTTFGQSSTTTGDGWHAVPSGTAQGLTGGFWNNVVVYGHDGNHYAYNFQNPIVGQYNYLQGYGGGFIKLRGNSAAGDYGNMTFIEPYGQVIVGGTGNGIDISASQQQAFNLTTFIRPQVIIDNVSGTTPAANPPTSAQLIVKEDANVTAIRMIAPDLETNVGSPFTIGLAGWSNDFDWAGLRSDTSAINSPAWGVNGLMYGPTTQNFNDTTGTGAVAGTTAMFAFPGTHITATGTPTYAILSTLNVAPPICSTNCNATRLSAISSTGEIFTTSDIGAQQGAFISGGTTSINNNSNFITNLGTGTTTQPVNIGGASNLVSFAGTIVHAGAVPTPTGSCAINTQLGGNLAGSFKANGTCAAGTVILTFAKAATTGWACDMHDLTTASDAMNQTAYATGSATFTGTMVSADLVTFKCEGF